MPNNKKPRKRYRPKPVRAPWVSKKSLDYVMSVVERYELVAEIALPRGTADYDDMNCLKSLLNHAMLGAISRGWLDKEERREGLSAISKAGKALTSVVDRAFARNKEKPAFVCTADELNAVRNGVAVAGPFIRDSMEETPIRCMQEFYAMKALLKRTPPGMRMTPEIIERMIDEMKTTPSWEWEGRQK